MSAVAFRAGGNVWIGSHLDPTVHDVRVGLVFMTGGTVHQIGGRSMGVRRFHVERIHGHRFVAVRAVE